MFIHDYIMRLIREMVRALLKTFLNDKSDEFLAEHNFCKEEMAQDIQALLDEYGLGELSKTLLMDQ